LHDVLNKNTFYQICLLLCSLSRLFDCLLVGTFWTPAVTKEGFQQETQPHLSVTGAQCRLVSSTSYGFVWSAPYVSKSESEVPMECWNGWVFMLSSDVKR